MSGVSDVTTDYCHAEIKEWQDWKTAYGQLKSYNRNDPKEKLQAYFFGKYQELYKLNAIDVLNADKIDCYEFKIEDNIVLIIDLATNEIIHTHNQDI
jgi:hypothetical protein